MRYAEMWPKYAVWWDRMRPNASRVAEFQRDAQFAIAHKAQYQAIEARTGVPWPLIAILHRRESDSDFDTYLGNGQSLRRRTTIVPKGRGPFLGPNAFVDGAVDALRIDGLSSVKDWRLEKVLYYCETFNGWGYAARGLPSPYIFGGTSVQKPGKYVSDGRFNSRAWDTQPGCAPILQAIMNLDSSVAFERESPPEVA